MELKDSKITNEMQGMINTNFRIVVNSEGGQRREYSLGGTLPEESVLL